MAVKTTLAQQGPFEGLAVELAAAYQQQRHELTREERHRRIAALMLASYFSSELAGFDGAGQPIDIFCSAIESAGGQVTESQRRKYLKTVSLSPARYGVVMVDHDEEVVVVTFDLLRDENRGSLEECQQYVAEKLRAAEVAQIPTVNC